MSQAHLQTILKHAESLATDPVSALDSELLARFLATQDNRAFSALVRRHGAMVWSVCRNLLPADADAEDAFQATFLALVRSGGRIRDGERLASWLHGVAFRIAMKLRRTSARRKVRETVAATHEASEPVSESSWNDLLAAVHEEVERLPETLRSPFVLCCLEGMRQHDAAGQLGLKSNTLATRLARARQRILERLARRGIAVGMASSAVAVGSATGRSAVPALLLDRTDGFVRDTESIPSPVLKLSQGAFDMSLRTKWLVAALLVAGAMTTTVGTIFFSNATGQFPDERSRRGGGVLGGGSPNTQAAMMARTAQTWEYRVVKYLLHTADAEKDLNKLGDEGWELTITNDQGMLVFKRQKARQFPFGEGGRGGSGGSGGTGTGAGGAGAAGGVAGDTGTAGVGEKKADSTHVIPIKHARATTLAATIAPLLGSDESSGRGSPFGGGGFNPGSRRTATGRMSIAVDDRTNSIIVITDDATLKTIKELVEKLDVQVKDEPKK